MTVSTAASPATPATVLHDPTSELAPEMRPRRAAPPSLEGRVVALQGIGKQRSDEFLDHVKTRLEARGIATIRTDKPTNARRAPTGLLQRIATEADVVVQALAD
ncbi:MAG: hypothetical protein F4Y74_07385 [Gemmatimonadales bacterium]|nr:hypothetical protein [Gemmatimonadales bacterium]MYG20180.1 hypothetical protein [Gemmatimonadales bacterium]MYH10858.1 hypothetical protein [Gemmatimonadales bacterium]MYL06065.1 hypothetical protein [Gemmatimonadales bacterium]